MVSNDNPRPKPAATSLQFSPTRAGSTLERGWPKSIWTWLQTQLWIFVSDRGEQMHRPHHHFQLVDGQLYARVSGRWEKFATPNGHKWKVFCPVIQAWLPLTGSGRVQFKGSIEQPISREGW